jgi:hypothetical protein
MMTLAMVLLALSCFFLWVRKAQWGWTMVMAVLVIGIIIFVRDVDFSTNLGIQL